jgi:hypothetical protein
MVQTQTLQVLSGISIAALYLVVVMIFGMGLWKLLVGNRTGQADISLMKSIEVGWLGFVLGQGVLGIVWLFVAMTGTFYPWIVWVITWGALSSGVLVLRNDIGGTMLSVVELLRRARWSVSLGPWYGFLSMAIFGVVVMKSISALAPTDIDDALMWYLVSPLSIAASHAFQLQPYLSPHNGLYPLQVEMHWAALFAIGNETAVLAWDSVCAVSLLLGVGGLAWKVTGEVRVGLIAMLLLLSTDGFFHVMGGGKADIGGAQYGVAAFWSLLLFPEVGRKAFFLAGGFLGWSIASRYTNVILLPAIILGLFWTARSTTPGSMTGRYEGRWRKAMLQPLVYTGLASIMTAAPMFVKNWLSVGCPFAPLIGCRGTFWADMFDLMGQGRNNLSGLDLLFYPFVWTFSERPDMLGNLSPLYVGLVPFVFILSIRRAIPPGIWVVGAMGMVALGTWLLIEPFVLFTRFLLVPLGLLALPLGMAFVLAERSVQGGRWGARLMNAGIMIVCLWLIFDSRSVVYGLRYAVGVDDRESKYSRKVGYDVAQWLNENVAVGKRIAVAEWEGYRLFLKIEHLLNSESAQEMQWLWTHRPQVQGDKELMLASQAWTPEIWRFYLSSGFSYVVLLNTQVKESEQAWKEVRPDQSLPIVYVGRENTVLKIL